MRRRLATGLVLVLALALLVALIVRPRGQAPPRGVVHNLALGPARALPPALLGVDGEAIIGGGIWSDPRFVSTVAALHPQAIRVFGGTPANFWNWRTGTYVNSPRVPSTLAALRTRIHFTLADWAQLVRAAGATPVFDLNMFTSDLRSQLAMLHAASGVGIPITHVELGNELYLPQYGVRFRNGADYGRVASQWTAAITRDFPGVQVAADAYPGRDTNTGTVNERELRWNSELLSTLKGASALSLHAYFASGLGPDASLASPAAAEEMLKAPTRRWAALSRLIAGLPSRFQIWVTEWNLFDTVARVHGTWAQGLADAAFGLDLLSSRRVTQSDYETLVNSAPFGAIFGTTAGLQLDSWGGDGQTFRAVLAPAPSTPLFGLATGGVALQALLGALNGATVSRPIVFKSAPVEGIGVGGQAGLGAVIVNLSAKPFLLSVPQVLRGLPYIERSAPPITLVTGTNSLQNQAGTTGATFALEPFALLQIGKAG